MLHVTIWSLYYVSYTTVHCTHKLCTYAHCTDLQCTDSDCIVACFILHDDHYQTLQLTIICYQTKESVRGKKLEPNSINCGAAILLKVSMVIHGFCNEKKIKDLKNATLGKMTVQTSLYYTQIEENSNIWGGTFSYF